MSPLLSWITALLLSTVAHCATNDPCQNFRTLSDPWRNVGFFFSGAAKSDSNLKEGWYNFTGIGGDRIVQFCPDTKITPTSEFSSYNSSTHIKLYTCDTVFSSSKTMCAQKGVDTRDCGGGLILYYLTPTNGLYASRHSSCIKSSCGENAHCSVVRGSCECDAGLSIPVGFQPSGDSFGCTDFPVTEPKKCQANFTVECVMILLNQIENSTEHVIPQTVIVFFLEKLLNSTKILEDESSEQNKVIFYGNSVLNATEKLVSSLVRTTDTYYFKNISLSSLEATVFVVGPNVSLTKTPQINSSNNYLEIDLIQISKYNKDAVIFLSYSSMSDFLKPSFFNTTTDMKKTMISSVTTVKLLSTKNQQMNNTMMDPMPSKAKQPEHQPEQHFNLTMEHTTAINPRGILSCVNWRETKWVQNSCKMISNKNGFTTCSCIHPGTFALIMQTSESLESTPLMDLMNLLNTVAVSVGLVFLSLTLVTFAFCQKQSIVINTALINLCLSLLLTHLLFLLTQNYLPDIHSVPVLCAALSGVLHFLFLSAFVWMFIDAVLLFISVKNLTKIRSKQTDIVDWKYLILIGYLIPLVVVGVSVGLFSEGYGSEQCWLKNERGLLWSFLGPVCFILASNLVLFIIISSLMISTLRKLNSQILQANATRKDNRLVKSVMVKTLLQFFIIGCPWILGFFTKGSEVVKILFLIINSQQGTFIFFIHCILNYEIRQRYKTFFYICFSSKALEMHSSITK
ncbi:adhesion G protein-coupled receptor E3-like [Salminus brasiliensis]|uniref:adhesion G protein-coupled receptor E3-like n=1 Tax=Salminus brasiliensis TaxID=930266 RepID=UPI003B832B3D